MFFTGHSVAILELGFILTLCVRIRVFQLLIRTQCSVKSILICYWLVYALIYQLNHTQSLVCYHVCFYLAVHSQRSVCHNTGRTVSPYKGYLHSPGYPLLPSQASVDSGVVCRCMISAISRSSDAVIQLLLVDMYSSKQVIMMVWLHQWLLHVL